MSTSIRFCEKFREVDADHLQQKETDLVLTSIRNHVVALLATRQGSVLIDRSFGVPDSTGNVCGEAHWLRATEQYLTKSETRLADINAEHLSYNEALGFNELKIMGMLLVENAMQQVVMTAHLFDQGNADIVQIELIT